MDEQQQNTIEDSQKLFISKVYYNLIKYKCNREVWRDFNSLENEDYKRIFQEYWKIEYSRSNCIHDSKEKIHRIKIINQICGEHPTNPNNQISLYEKEINIIIEGDFQNYNEQNIETIFHSFKQLKNKRMKRKFSKLLSCFAKPKYIEYNELLNKGFGGAEECCVCKEETFSRTKCGHILCFVCRTNLRKKDCPMCRNSLIESDSDNE